MAILLGVILPTPKYMAYCIWLMCADFKMMVFTIILECLQSCITIDATLIQL